jgi:Dolichyl-phosphate-mannose-protein mannosyltransferase
MLAGETAASGTRAARVPAPSARSGPAARALAGYRLGVAAITAGAGLFLLLRLTVWPPHEDETLVFFVSRRPLGELLETVLGDRGGAPLHFVLAHLALLVDESLTALRALSAVLAVASIPLIAALVARLIDRRTALLAALLSAASWMLLFHGVYARMYGLFLFTSVLSFLLLVRAVERGSVWRWTAWAAASLALVATQPYGALALGAQALWVGLVRLRRPLGLRGPLLAFGAVLLLAAPLWRTYLHLASRFDVGVGEGSDSELGSLDVLGYLWRAVEDFTAGWEFVAVPAALVALAGLVVLARRRPEAALLVAAVALVPALALLVSRSGSGLHLETRHLIFVLPFFAAALAAGLLEAARRARRAGPLLLALGVAGLVAAQLAWGWTKTPWLYGGEPAAREEARAEAAAWLASTSRADDVLFGYEPTYLDAWGEGAPFGALFVPRADPALALETLQEAGEPLGRGVWVLDASDELDPRRERLQVAERTPGAGFEARAFGPFLVLRTEQPEGSVSAFLHDTIRVEQMAQEMEIGDAWVNLGTATGALELLADRGYRFSAASRSTTSR